MCIKVLSNCAFKLPGIRSQISISDSFLIERIKEYDRSDGFPFDYEPNGIAFGL